MSYKIDTGVQVNVLPKKYFNRLSPRPKLKSTAVKLSAYNDTSIPVAVKSHIPLIHKRKKHHVLFIIVSSETTPIIGLKTSERRSLVQHVFEINGSEPFNPQEIPDKYFDCLGEIVTLKNTYYIELKEDVKPVVVLPRKVPFALREPLKRELDCMEKLGVITKVEKSTDRVNGLVTVTKPNGKLHICLDPWPLNQAIKRHHHHLPAAEVLILQMHGA